MTRIAYLVTSAREMTLADGTPYATGYLVEEALKPYELFRAAGFDVTVITPYGQPPHAEPYGLSWFFHYPDEDKDYLASVVRTFAHHVDDIRLTLYQNSQLGLAAARRAAALLQANGCPAAEAHRVVSAAAKTAWRQDRQFADVLAEDGSHGLTREQIQAEVDAQRADSERLAEGRHRKLQEIPGFQRPAALSSLTDAELEEFDAVFVPGGHGSMVDLSDNPDAGRLLAALYRKGALIAALCHGPAVLLSAPERADGLWLFDGYRMTSFTDEEESRTRPGRLGMAWLLDAALKNAGAVFDDGPSAWASHVVVDRNLITGQNAGSTEAIADAVIKKLHARAGRAAPAAGPAATPRSTPPMASRAVIRSPAQTVQAFLDAFAGHDIDAAIAVVGPQVSVTVHPLGLHAVGADTLRRVLTDLLSGFPDLMISVSRVISTGDVVTALFKAEGTQAAGYAGAINQEKHLDIDQAWRFVARDGLITELTAYWCQAQLYRRLAVKRYDQIAIA
ncbi:MAG TPA: DJ-1/PfpI family protein [Streptosporangiaceae bacterium]|nr:DJ-1/PfpI family protein [Streptosporangiaceae bacterium]